MKFKTSMLLAIIAMGLIAVTPAQAQRSHGGHGNGYFWGPFGFLLGSAILYSAVQSRPVYYGPQVVYASPLYARATTVVQPYYAEQTYVPPPAVSMPPPPYIAQTAPVESASGQWWYFCKKPSGYYPYVRECPSGWEKVSPTPSGAIKP